MRLNQVSWKQLAKEVRAQAKLDNVFNGGAALAFYLTLAIFPALIFLLSLLPYLPIPNLDRAIMDLLHQGLPEEAASILEQTVSTLVNDRQGGLLSLGFIGTIWAASSGMYAIMQQLNITYEVTEERPFVRARATALLLTFLFGVLVIGGFALVVGGGALQEWIAGRLGWSQGLVLAFGGLRWLIILLFLLLAFSVIYYFGPNVEQRFQWISPGAAFGVVMLLVTSLLFRIYIENFGNYAATYGSIGAIVVLMLWLYVAGLVLLIGSEINVAFEKQVAGGERRGNEGVREKEASSAPRSSGASPA
jgi:membrane protein